MVESSNRKLISTLSQFLTEQQAVHIEDAVRDFVVRIGRHFALRSLDFFLTLNRRTEDNDM